MFHVPCRDLLIQVGNYAHGGGAGIGDASLLVTEP